MAYSFLTPVDLNQLELLNARIQNLATAPGTPVVGQIYFDTVLNKARIYFGAPINNWVNLDGSDIPDSSVTSAKIANGAILNEDINASAAIALSKLATDPLARANHTGTQAPATILFASTARILGRITAAGGPGEELTAAQVKTILALVAADISGFDTQVRTSRLDQMAAPTAPVNFNGQVLNNVADPSVDTDGANKRYVDLARAGIRLKDSVLVKTTVQMALSGLTSTDGVTPTDGDRILVANQTDSSENGIYNAHPGAWTRATDADTAAELTDGATVWVNEGSQQNTTWAQINTLTSLAQPQVWTQQGAASVYLGGNGIDITGQTIDVVPGNGILADGTSTRVDPAVVARKYTATVGNGAATSIVRTHNLGNQWVTAQVVRNTAPFDLVGCDIQLTDANNVTLVFVLPPTTDQYRVIVTG